MRKKKSSILEAVHETAKGLHEAGVMDQVTLHKLDLIKQRYAEAKELASHEP